MRKEKVAVVKVNHDIYSAVNKGLKLIGGIKKGTGQKIVIKPNLCINSPPDTGRTTDVRIIKALIDDLSSSESSVYVVESKTRMNTLRRTFKKLGYKSLEKKKGVQLIDLSKERVRIESLNGKFFKYIKIPEVLSDYDHFISVAKLKTHLFERISAAYKNQWGCIPSKEKLRYHPFLNEVLFDLNSVFKPNLCLIDGIVGLEGCGPTDGLPKITNLLIFGRDALSTDSVACHVIGIDPMEVPHLKYAYENGQGEIRLEEIKVIGEPLEKVRTRFAFISGTAYNCMRLGLRLGRYPPPMLNLGISLFNWGNYIAGKTFSTRLERWSSSGSKISAWKALKRSITTRVWNV
jgi:uncharacterized protein (DUF362 family)